MAGAWGFTNATSLDRGMYAQYYIALRIVSDVPERSIGTSSNLAIGVKRTSDFKFQV